MLIPLSLLTKVFSSIHYQVRKPSPRNLPVSQVANRGGARQWQCNGVLECENTSMVHSSLTAKALLRPREGQIPTKFKEGCAQVSSRSIQPRPKLSSIKSRLLAKIQIRANLVLEQGLYGACRCKVTWSKVAKIYVSSIEFATCQRSIYPPASLGSGWQMLGRCQ